MVGKTVEGAAEFIGVNDAIVQLPVKTLLQEKNYHQKKDSSPQDGHS